MIGADTRGITDVPRLAHRRYVSYHVICLALLPLGLLAINPNVFINPGGNGFIDPWVYTGFFLSFPDLLHRFGDTYYATRLPWLLPGFALHTILPPLAANYALHLTFFYLLLLSTYALVASGANRSAAFVTTLLVAWNPLLLTSFSWDYVDGAGIVFLLIAICSLERAGRAGAGASWWRWSLVAGAGMACLVATNLALVTALPACAAFLFVCSESPRWRSTTAILAISVVGASATLVILGALNRAFGGSWFFLQPSIHFGMRIRTATNIWKAPAFDWRQAEWIALPIAAAIGAIVSLVVRRRVATRFERALQVALLAFFSTWLLFDLVADTAFFRYWWYTSYLVALALIALPLQGGPPAGDGKRRSVVGFELAILAVLAAPHVLAWIDPPYRYPFVHWAQVALLVGVIGLQVIRPLSVRWAVFVLGLMLSYAASTQYWTVPAPRGRADFVATVGAHRFIAKNVGNRTMRIWHPTPTATSPPFEPIRCTYLCNRMFINDELPRLTREEALEIKPQMRLVLLVNRESEADEARASLRVVGLDYAVVAREQFGPGDRRFLVIVADVVQAPPQV